MLDRRAKICRRHPRDEGKDRIQILDRQLQRHDRRRCVGPKRCRYGVDLGKCRVRIERVERLKPNVPVVKRAQQSERWRRSDSLHSVAVIDNVAAPAMGKRQFFAQCRVAFKHRFPDSYDLFDQGSKNWRSVGLKLFYRGLAHIRNQPVAERLGIVRPGLVGGIEIPGLADASEHCLFASAKIDTRLGRFARLNQSDADTVLQRESGKNMTQQSGFDQIAGRAQPKDAFLGRCRKRPEQNDKKKKCQMSQLLPFRGMEYVARVGSVA